MQVEVYNDEQWPVMFCEPMIGKDRAYGTVCDIPDSLYAEWRAVNKRKAEIAAEIWGYAIRAAEERTKEAIK